MHGSTLEKMSRSDACWSDLVVGFWQVQGDCPPIGGFFVVVVCTLFILNPDLLGPRMQVPGVGWPSPALVTFMFVLFCSCVDFCEVMMMGR